MNNNSSSSNIFLLTCTILLIFFLISCKRSFDTDLFEGSDIHDDKEFFDKSGMPIFIKYKTGDYYISKPWGYDKLTNSKKKYPLFIYLHGTGSKGTPDLLPCFNNNDDKKNYPSFVYFPHTHSGWDIQKHISQIESFKAKYRIDTNRIYVVGYSLGGGAAYYLAKGYYETNNQFFAAIIRMASSKTPSTVPNAIADKTSIWYHVGKDDKASRVEVAKNSYEFLKNYHANSSAKESSGAAPFANYPGTTLTLTKGGIEVVKYTVYDSPTGHLISHFPFNDPYLLKWLFNQSLEKI